MKTSRQGRTMLKNSQLPLSPAGPFDSYLTPAGVGRDNRGRAKRHISGVKSGVVKIFPSQVYQLTCSHRPKTRGYLVWVSCEWFVTLVLASLSCTPGFVLCTITNLETKTHPSCQRILSVPNDFCCLKTPEQKRILSLWILSFCVQLRSRTTGKDVFSKRLGHDTTTH